MKCEEENKSRAALKVVAVYQDTLTQAWADESRRQIIRQSSRESLVYTSWHIDQLTQPLILPAVVQAAVQADIFVVSLWATGEVPVNLSVWCTLWLPRRPRRAGYLMALIGLARQNAGRPSAVSDYLQAVAGRGGLAYATREQRLPTIGNELSSERLACPSLACLEANQPFLGLKPSLSAGWG